MKVKPLRGARGQELVEFALTLPIMILLLMGIFDMGRVVIYYSSLHNAVREGARYGIVHGGPKEIDKDRVGVKNRVVNMAIGLGPDFDSSDVEIPEWDDKVIRVRATYMFSPVTPLIGRFLTGGKIQLVGSSRMWVEY